MLRQPPPMLLATWTELDQSMTECQMSIDREDNVDKSNHWFGLLNLIRKWSMFAGWSMWTPSRFQLVRMHTNTRTHPLSSVRRMDSNWSALGDLHGERVNGKRRSRDSSCSLVGISQLHVWTAETPSSEYEARVWETSTTSSHTYREPNSVDGKFGGKPSQHQADTTLKNPRWQTENIEKERILSKQSQAAN